MPGKLMMSSRTGFGVVALVGARDYGVRGFAGWHDFAPDAAVDNVSQERERLVVQGNERRR